MGARVKKEFTRGDFTEGILEPDLQRAKQTLNTLLCMPSILT